jgi:C_GCAxxG_C_C family probable redox protein
MTIRFLTSNQSSLLRETKYLIRPNSIQRTEAICQMKSRKNEFSEKAVEYFNKDYNCAQSVLLAMQEYYGIPANELIPKIATPFGAGIGRCGSLCGAFTGAVLAIGAKHGTDTTNLKEKEKSYKFAQKLYEQFVKIWGSPFCRELIGYDLNDPKQLEEFRKSKIRDEKCAGFVKKTVDILVSLEEE